MTTEQNHWQYYLVDEFNNSYVVNELLPPVTNVIPNTPTEFIETVSDVNSGSQRIIVIKFGPNYTTGRQYHISINGIDIYYEVQVGDTLNTVRNALRSKLNSTMYPDTVISTGVFGSPDELTIISTPPLTSFSCYIGTIVQQPRVSTISGKVPLTFTPDGWQDISIAWERNFDRWGNIRNFSIPLKFVLDGANILREIAYTTNYEKKVFLLIEKLKLDHTPTTYNYAYRDYYKGEIDLSTYVDEENLVTVNIMEGDLQKLLKSNENTVYEIPCDEFMIHMDGLELKGNYHYVTIQEIMTGTVGTPMYKYKWPLVAFVNFEGIGVEIETPSTNPNTNHSSSSINDDNYYPDNYFFGRLDSSIGTYTYDIKIRATISLVASDEMVVYVKNSNGSRLYLATLTGGLGSYSQEYFMSGQMPVAPGEKLYLIYRMKRNTNAGLSTGIVSESTIDIGTVTKFKPTNIFAIKPYTLFGRLIEKICGDSSYIQSQILQDYEHLAVTCGDAIRGFPSASCRIKTSLNDFFKSFNAILSIGMGVINGKIVLESKEYFTQDVSHIAIGEVKDLKVSFAKEIIFNTIKIGYPNQTYDDVNGRYEFNNTSQYTVPVTRFVKELDLVSVYRADPYGIEFTRINLDGKTTTDNSSDNDTFIINADIGNEFPDGSTALKRVTYNSISGIPYPDSIFNIEDLTPARMLKRHLPYIYSALDGFQGEEITFQTTSKNRGLETDDGISVYDEDADLVIGTTGKYFKPVLFEFEARVPTDLTEVLSSNPNRCFSFTLENGEIFKGYNIKVGIKPDSNEKQTYLLLSTNSNDLSKLI